MKKRMMKKILSSKLFVLLMIFVAVSFVTVIAGDLIFKEGNLESGDLNVTGNLTAQNYYNSTGTCKDLNQWGGSSGAQYQFTNNNFNGSGNFTTTGNVNANTLTATGTGTFGTVKASSCYGSLGIKDCGSNYYTYIQQYYGTHYNTQDRVLYLHL